MKTDNSLWLLEQTALIFFWILNPEVPEYRSPALPPLPHPIIAMRAEPAPDTEKELAIAAVCWKHSNGNCLRIKPAFLC